MRLLPVICLSCLSLLLIILPGCHSKSTTTSAATETIVRPAHALIFIDSLLRPDNDPYHAQPEFQTAFILSDSAQLYVRDTAGNMSPIATLHMRDSISIRTIGDMPYMNAWYAATWHGKTAYVWGNDLAVLNSDLDFDGDGRTDEIMYGYTDYDTTSHADEIGRHPLWMRFISATGHRYELHDTGYSTLWFQEVADSSETRFTRPTRVLEISAGYQACSYPAYRMLVVTRDGKPEIVSRYVSNIDSGIGTYYDINLPDALHGHPDSIYVLQYLSHPLNDQSDSLVSSPVDSSVIYLSDGRWTARKFWTAPEYRD